MRTIEEYHEILDLWEQGENKMEIARRTGIPHRTVVDCVRRYKSIAGLEEALKERIRQGALDDNSARQRLINASPEIHEAYTYLLGLYLGDGTLSKDRCVYRLRIFLDAKYPGIIAACQTAMETVLPENRVTLLDRNTWFEVIMHYKYWPALLPQHGPGRKHTRLIELAPWQETLVSAHPLALLRGLYHSDGSRSQNIVKGRDYPRYLFANESPGIRALFCAACDRLGLGWTIANRRNVCISRREDVAWLDHEIGPKS